MNPVLIERFAEAYVSMAEVLTYRPKLPRDFRGSSLLTDEQKRDKVRLMVEAYLYAREFDAADAAGYHLIGTSNFTTNRALVYVIEAAKLLCRAGSSLTVRCLLAHAIQELKDCQGKKE